MHFRCIGTLGCCSNTHLKISLQIWAEEVLNLAIAENQVEHTSRGINCLDSAFFEELPFCFLIPILNRGRVF